MTTPNYREQARAWLKERGFDAQVTDEQSLAVLLARIAEEERRAIIEEIDSNPTRKAAPRTDYEAGWDAGWDSAALVVVRRGARDSGGGEG